MLEKKIKGLLNQYFSYRSIKRDKEEAYSALQNIQSVKGKTEPRLLKLSDEYAVEVLGWKGHAPWLYVYSSIYGDFKEGWIPQKYYVGIVTPRINGNYRGIGNYVSLVNYLFNSDAFPDLMYVVNGMILTPEYKILNIKEAEELVLSQIEKVVYKIENSKKGRGVQIIDKENFDLQYLKKLGNGVLQSYIKQSPFFNEIEANSVATLRITTVVDNEGVVSARASFLRVGRVSDTHVKSTSSIKISIDINSGMFQNLGYLPNWIPIEKHPDSNFIFSGNYIPNFEECKKMVIDLHKKVPFIRIVGWDLTLDYNDVPKIMEWNTVEPGIKFTEATQGPCFSDLGYENLWKNENV